MSSRYTLKELKNTESFLPLDEKNLKRPKVFLDFTENRIANESYITSLAILRLLSQENISNDLAKFAMTESYKTELTWSINARNLQNFLHLRSSKSALWEIRNLALAIFDAIPKEHQFIFVDLISKEKM